MKRRRSEKAAAAPSGITPRIAVLVMGSILLVAGITTYSYTRPAAVRGVAPGRTSAVVQKRARELIRYADMTLPPEQQAIKTSVLASIPAVCCSKYPLSTCCCACNFTKTVWGLSNYVLTVEQADASRLRAAVDDWIRETNPAGYSGDACFKGGCKRPFAENGCGGMDQAHMVF